MRRAALAVVGLVVATGCQYIVGIEDPPPLAADGGGTADAAIPAPDARPGAADAAPRPADASVPDAGPWTPTSLPHLAMWLDGSRGVTASAGKVSSWSDQSGLGNDVIQQNSSLQPMLASGAINDLDGIYFSHNGTPVELLAASPSPGIGSGDHFILVVYKSSLATGTAADLVNVEASSTTSTTLSLTPPDLFASVTVGGSGKYAISSGLDLADGQPHVAGLRRVGSDLTLYVDGLTFSTTGVPTGDVSGKIVIGGQLLGTITEVLIDSGTVDDGQVAQAIAYLKRRYALSF